MTKENDFIDYKARAYVSSADKLPEVEHYAMLTNITRDDGYGGRSPAIEYTAFLNKDELEWEIRKRSEQPYSGSYRVIHVRPVKVETKIVVDVETK